MAHESLVIERGVQGGDYYGGAAAVGLIQALVPALLMNIAIVGLNQLTDVEIDRVNKPYLPLASGELTMQQVKISPHSIPLLPPMPQMLDVKLSWVIQYC